MWIRYRLPEADCRGLSRSDDFVALPAEAPHKSSREKRPPAQDRLHPADFDVPRHIGRGDDCQVQSKGA
jgi:hypothetical protein